MNNIYKKINYPKILLFNYLYETDKYELINRSNQIIEKVFNLIKIEVKITELEKEYSFETPCLK